MLVCPKIGLCWLLIFGFWSLISCFSMLSMCVLTGNRGDLMRSIDHVLLFTLFSIYIPPLKHYTNKVPINPSNPNTNTPCLDLPFRWERRACKARPSAMPDPASLYGGCARSEGAVDQPAQGARGLVRHHCGRKGIGLLDILEEK